MKIILIIICLLFVQRYVKSEGDLSRFFINVLTEGETDHKEGCFGVMISDKWALSCTNCIKRLYEKGKLVKLTAGFSLNQKPQVYTDVEETRTAGKGASTVLLRIKDPLKKSDKVDWVQLPPPKFTPCEKPTTLDFSTGNEAVAPAATTAAVPVDGPSPPPPPPNGDVANKTANSSQPDPDPNIKSRVFGFLLGLIVTETFKLPKIKWPFGKGGGGGGDMGAAEDDVSPEPGSDDVPEGYRMYPKLNELKGPQTIDVNVNSPREQLCKACSGRPMMCGETLVGMEVNCLARGLQDNKFSYDQTFDWIYYRMRYIVFAVNGTTDKIPRRVDNTKAPDDFEMTTESSVASSLHWQPLLLVILTVVMGAYQI